MNKKQKIGNILISSLDLFCDFFFFRSFTVDLDLLKRRALISQYIPMEHFISSEVKPCHCYYPDKYINSFHTCTKL